MLRTHVLRGLALACVLGFTMGASDLAASPETAACDPGSCPLPCTATCTAEQAAACPLPCAATKSTGAAAFVPSAEVETMTGTEAACPFSGTAMKSTGTAACPRPCASERSTQHAAGDGMPRTMVGMLEIL